MYVLYIVCNVFPLIGHNILGRKAGEKKPLEMVRVARAPQPGSRFIATPRNRGQKARLQCVVLFGTVCIYSYVTLCVSCLFIYFFSF